MDSCQDSLAGGLPHSETHGSTPARGSPWLFAACHVLHRLLVPRHPPNALLILDIPSTRLHVWTTMPGNHPQDQSPAPSRPFSDDDRPLPASQGRSRADIIFSTDHTVP